MPGLVLKLRPDEEVMINGVVLQNGERSARLTVRTPDARILRLREAIAPEEATTPLRKACLHLQLAVSGNPTAADDERLAARLDALMDEARTMGAAELLDKARMALDVGNHYAAWRAIKKIVDCEGAGRRQPSSVTAAPGDSSSTGTA